MVGPQTRSVCRADVRGRDLVDESGRGALAAVAGLYVGLQDRNEPARFTAETMTAQSVLFFIVVLARRVVQPWVASAIMILCAALSGLSAQHDKSISRMFADVLNVLAFLALSRMTHELVIQSALAVWRQGCCRPPARLWPAGGPATCPSAGRWRWRSSRWQNTWTMPKLRQKSTTGPAAEAAIVEATRRSTGLI